MRLLDANQVVNPLVMFSMWLPMPTSQPIFASWICLSSLLSSRGIKFSQLSNLIRFGRGSGYKEEFMCKLCHCFCERKVHHRLMK